MATVAKQADAPCSASSHMGGWAWIGLLLALLVVFYTGAVRYLDPVGEKYVDLMSPGGADFVYPFNGARALLAGVDPYTHDVAELFDPWKRDQPVNGVMFRQFYPPSHLAAYLPLAIVSGGDFRVASRLWFHLNLIFLLGIVLACCELARLVLRWTGPPRELWLCLLPVFLFVLGSSQPTSFGLERGQSDIFAAFLCWLCCLLWLRGERFLPMVLVMIAALLKGYALPFGFGLGVLGLLEGRRRLSVLAGAILPVLALVVPVLSLFPKGIEASVDRADMFWNTWHNHSLKNLVYQFSPALAEPGRLLLSALTGLVVLLLWWRLFRADAREQPVWMVLFCSVSFSLMLGLSGLSVTYNLILVLPGALVLVAGQGGLRRAASLGGGAALGSLLALTAFCLVLPRLGSDTFPVASIGLLGLSALGGWTALTARPALGS